MTATPEGAGPDDLASTADLFKLTFDLADQVAAQITPADTERAIERIMRSVETEGGSDVENSAQTPSANVQVEPGAAASP